MDKELNKKLAEWAGFKVDLSLKHSGASIDPSGKHIYEAPKFTDSLDACFKWLVPKLQDKGNNVELYAYEHKGYMATVYKDCFSQRGSDGYEPYLEPIGQVKDDNPALALCLAIEKLIDGGKE